MGVPPEFEKCATAERLGTKNISLVQVFTGDGRLFIDLCMPKDYGLVYQRLLPNRKWLKDYYASSFDQAADGTQSVDEIKRQRLTNKVEGLCRGRIPPKARVLDVGCGFGDQLFFFKHKGHECVGLEPGKARCEFGRREFGLDIVNGEIGSSKEIKFLRQKYGAFDLICLNQVLEHLPDPVHALTGLRTLLKPDGQLFIAVPDFYFEGLLNKVYTTVHTHSFTQRGLIDLTSRIGLHIKHDFGIEHYLMMLFEKGSNGAHPQGGREILDHLIDMFSLKNHSYRESDLLIQVANALGSWTAVYQYSGPPTRAIRNREEMMGLLPLRIETRFPKPQLLFK